MLTLKGNPDRLLLWSVGGSFLQSLPLIIFILWWVLLHLLVAQIKVISLAHCINVGSVAETKRYIVCYIRMYHGRESSILTWENIFFQSGISDHRSNRGEAPSPSGQIHFIFFVFYKYYFNGKMKVVLKARSIFTVCNGLLEAKEWLFFVFFVSNCLWPLQ